MDERDALDQGSPAHPAPAIASRDVAHYIAQMSAEMSVMADSCGLRRAAASLKVVRALCHADLADLAQSGNAAPGAEA